MFIQPDHTYRDIQVKNPSSSGLDEMERHEDLAVGGRSSNWPERICTVSDEIKRQEESNQPKIDYMKKLKNGR